MVNTAQVSLNNTPDPNSDVERAEQAVQQIYAEYNQAIELLDLMDADSTQMAKDNAELEEIEQALENLKNKWHLDVDTNLADYSSAEDMCDKVQAVIDKAYPKSWNIPLGIERDFGILESAKTSPSAAPGYLNPEDAALQDLFTKSQELNRAEKQLDALDPELKDLNNEINAIISSLSQINVNSKFLASDLASIMQFFTVIFKAMQQKLEADEDRALMTQGANGGLSQADKEKLYLDAVQKESNEQYSLSDLDNAMTAVVNQYHTVENKADEDMKQFNWCTHVGSAGMDCSKEEDIKLVRKNAQEMEDMLRDLMRDLSPAIHSTSSGLSDIGMMLNELIQQAEDIMKGNASPKEKQREILNVLGMALSLLSAIQGQVATDRAAIDKKIAQAMQNASLVSIEDSISAQHQMERLKHSANIMQKVLFSTKIIMTVVFSMFAPGLASELVMLTFSALDLSGGIDKKSILDKATDKLALWVQEQIDTDCGQRAEETSLPEDKQPSRTARLIAEAIVATGEAGALGVAAAADGPLASAAATAEESMKALIEAEIRMIAEDAAANLRQQGEVILQDQVDATVARLAAQTENTAQLVKEKTAQLIGQGSSLSKFTDLVKLARGTYKPATEAAKEAVQESYREAASLAETNLRGLLTDDVLTKQANRLANKAIADEVNLTEDEVEKATSDIGVKSAKKAAYLSVYAMANNNVLVDSVIEAMKKGGMKENEKSFEVIQNLVRILQSFIAMAGMVMASNGSQALSQDAVMWSSRLMNGSQFVTSSANAVAEGSLASTSMQQARVIPRVAKDKANIEAFQLLLTKLSQSQSSDQEKLNQDESDSYKSSLKIIHDGLLKSDDISAILAGPV